ncbi:MAG TPA: DEAD/DEAH box helicase, partial [Isosphaeraceae bacterium]|nr:DEAD/DEAH box helicase [Isosphaeraceae bacterium]
IGQATRAPGVVVGSTLAFWAHVFRFAGALVARQSFLPSVVRADGHKGAAFQARWEPVVTGADTQRLARLAQAMPHAARALTAAAALRPTKTSAAAISARLGTMVDHLVRSASAEPDLARNSQRGGRKAKQKTFASAHEQWLHALSAPNGQMEGDAAELERLLEHLIEWRRPIEVASAAPYRLCFRLEEPQVDDGNANGHAKNEDWYVRYLLQAADDPSLLLPAEQAWGRMPAHVGRSEFKSREYMLSALGQASSLCPRIEGSLKTAEPDGYAVDVTSAHEFLSEKAWLLEQAGFGVMLPAWWTRKGTKLRLAARAVVGSPKLRGESGLSLGEILNFKWEVALGDQTLTLNELKALARMKAPLVRVRGQWVQLSAEEIQHALDFWKKKGEKGISARDAVHMALGVADPPGGLDFEGVRADGWLADLIEQLQGNAGVEALSIPEGFRGTLRPYQERGYSWLGFLRRWGFGACLADDMGLGKTVQTLAAIQRDWESAEKPRPTLLICPMSVVGNWQKEARRFTPELPVMVHHGLDRTKGPAFKRNARKHALVLSSYALLHRDFEMLQQVPWAAVVLDEAQNIKNPETKQSRAARALKADARVALTGTPVENHVGDLWAIMEFLNPGLLGSQTEFRRSFHIPIQAQRDPDATRRLQKITGPFILRRLKTDKSIIADLPEKMEMKVFCNLTREQATLYQAVAEEAARTIAESTGIKRKGIVLATLSKLKQVCNHPTQFLGDNSAIPGRSGKLARLSEMLEEAILEGDRALVFTQFSEMGEILRRHLQDTFGQEVLFLHGGVSKPQRDRMVERFQSPAPDVPRLFVLSLKAGGTG